MLLGNGNELIRGVPFFLFRRREQEQIMGGVWSIISCGIINSRRFSLPGLCRHAEV